jgi:methionyl-tRNA formyltransferase
MVTNAVFRIVFFGTPGFAVPTLDRLLTSTHDVVAVVTQPDRPHGRGHRHSDAPVKRRALQAGVPVLQPSALKDLDFIEAMSGLRPDLGVVAAYGKILPERLLAIPVHGMINVHASLLPKYRGAAPIHRAIASGETETGVTIMRVVKALDAGPMLATVRRPVGDTDTSIDVERDLAEMGARLLVETVDRLAAGTAREVPQDDGLATYAPRLTREDGAIDWSESARAIHNLVRGMQPWPMAYSYLGGKRLIVFRSSSSAEPVSAQPGTIVTARGDELRVATGEGTLLVSELQAEGRRPMTTREFLAGHRIAPGERFSLPPAGSSAAAGT